MRKLDIYIVCHDLKSFEYFKEINGELWEEFKFILVGDYKERPIWMPKDSIVPSLLKYNIEQYKTLLTFTAWYALVKNDLIKSEYVGIFEYDCELSKDIFSVVSEMNSNTIMGFRRRKLPDKLFLTFVQGFVYLLSEEEKKIIQKQFYWCPTSNFIMPMKFLYYFVDWYVKMIPQILNINNHPHIHERAINVFAFKDYSILCKLDYIKHHYLCSHNIKLR